MRAGSAFRELLGPSGYIDQPEDMAPYLAEWRGRYESRAAAVLLPGSTAEVADAVGICRAEGIGIVPQGGNTGLCGGAVATDPERQVILCLRRMRQIRELDVDADFLIAEAGCVLADLQRAADEAGRLFPLSLSAEGSCQIGGNLATDAGGVNVLRYGTARQQALGLEVVLADGRVWNGLRTLRKNTAGYDLRDLFIGSEGTLGIITAAALKLWPRPADAATAFVALAAEDAALPLLGRLRERLGEQISAFELISGRALDFVTRHLPGARSPFEDAAPAYALIETTANDPGEATGRLETALADALERRLLLDAVVAGDGPRRQALWALRHGISGAQRHEGASIKHDIALPLHRIGDFLRVAGPAVEKRLPGARLVVFGHVGDGNLHFNVSQPAGMEAEVFLAAEPAINESVFGLVAGFGGTFSAEHGVGLLRREEMEHYLDAVELDLMRRLKRELDPAGILNPGKVL